MQIRKKSKCNTLANTESKYWKVKEEGDSTYPQHPSKSFQTQNPAERIGKKNDGYLLS